MNTFGKNFRVEIFGESHGAAVGAVIDGVKAGIPLGEEDFTLDVQRRKSGAKGTTPRTEADKPVILSGIYRGYTTGAPIAVIFNNSDTRSGDYEALKDLPRPGHADYAASVKWDGFNDPRGGGHFSGRLTLPLVAAGVIAKKMCQCRIEASLLEIGGEPDSSRWDAMLDEASKEGDSLGGIVECRAEGLPAGLGEPFFDSVESLLSHAVFSIPGVRGIEFGDGFAASGMRGSQHNDPFKAPEGGRPGAIPAKNGAGGINGGLTSGAPIVFRVAFKPTSSIARSQETLDVATGRRATLNVPGRHDVCFALRTPVIVEAAAAIVLADLCAGGK